MGLREDLHFRVTSIKEDDSRWWWWWWWEGLTSSPEKSRRGEEGGVESALGWSIQRDEGRNRGGWMARPVDGGASFHSENKSRVHVQTSLPAAA